MTPSLIDEIFGTIIVKNILTRLSHAGTSRRQEQNVIKRLILLKPGRELDVTMKANFEKAFERSPMHFSRHCGI